jgi:hypothetical protein
MSFGLEFTVRAKQELAGLDSNQAKLKRVRKCLALLETNPRHPGLEAHSYKSLLGANGEKVFEAYVENKTPAAWRVFWHYGPGKETITVLTITPHP